MEKRRNLWKVVWTVFLLAAIGLFLYSAYNLVKIYLEYEAGTQEYESLQQYVERKKTSSSDIEVEQEKSEKKNPVQISRQESDYAAPDVDFEALKAINPDVVGWIEIEAIPSISYPIVRGMDNEKYLNTTFENKSNIAGAIFMDYTNASNFTDSNTILYGHNMKNGSMFGLLSTIRDEEAYKKSPYFWICTPEGKYRYEIFTAHVAEETSETYSVFYEADDSFKTYLDKMQAITEIPTAVPLTKDDKIVTLSTCTSEETQRFVIQGKRID